MDDDLVLLTSYFNLANGRRQDTADTLRVDPSLPSRTSPDGTAALYIVTEASAGGHMGPRARKLVADTITWEYTQHGDDQPAPRLRAALRAAHQQVVREFDGHVSVGVSVVAVEHDQVFLAQVAPAQVYVLHEGSLHSISANVAGSSPFAHALGAAGSPEISVFRDEVGPGDVIALCSSWFNRSADADNLREAFGAGVAEDIAEALHDLAKEHGVRDASCIIIDAIRARDLDEESASEPHSLMEQVDMAVQALAGVGRMFLSELRASPQPQIDHNGDGFRQAPRAEPVSRTPGFPRTEPAPRESSPAEIPVHDQATAEFPHFGMPTQATEEPVEWHPDETHDYDLSAAQAPESTAPPASTPAPEEPIAPGPTRIEMPEPDDDAASYHRSPFRDRRGPPEPVAEPESASSHELDAVNTRIRRQPDLTEDTIPPVQAFPDTSTQPSRIYAPTPNMQAANRRPRRFGGIARPQREGSGAAPVLRPSLGDFDVRQRMARQAPPAAVWGGAAAVGVLVLIAIIIYLNRGHGGANNAATSNPYPQRFAADLGRLRAAVLPALQNTYITQAHKDIALARANGTSPKTIAFYNLELQQTIDTVDKVDRVSAPVIAADFSKIAGSNPTQLASGSQNIFVLDSGKQSVYSIVPGSAPTSSPTQIVQKGEQDSGLTVGTPMEIATDGPTALILDNANVLVLDNTGVKTAITLQQLSPAQKVTAMVDYAHDVLVLDAVGGQIVKYTAAATGVASNPVGIFSNQVSLGNAVSLTNDDTALYVMMKDGSIQKYDYQGNKQSFTLPELRVPLQNPTSVFTDVGLKYIWIADPTNNRVVQLSKASGKYCGAYAPSTTGAQTMDLTHATAVVVPPDGKNVYVLSGKQIFDFPVVAPRGCP